jgi:predicted metallo-beta-lactamase superfamily hydrolase
MKGAIASRHRLNDMHIKILGSESLGVRGLSCVVELKNRKIFIDPGLALGYDRHGYLPHPAQVAVGEAVRCEILAELKHATDIVMSHFHGDHVPLSDANPFQLSLHSIGPLDKAIRLWTKGGGGLSQHMIERRASIRIALQRDLPNAEEHSDGMLTFSGSVSHGIPSSRLGKVMMTRIQGPDTVFVHASDMQLYDDRAVTLILNWKPDIVFVSGPAIYRSQHPQPENGAAWRNALQLANHVHTLILDHHLLRCEEGLSWLDRLSHETGHDVICPADFMQRPRCLLEARRVQLYEELLVPDDWHDAYACGKANTEAYQQYRKRCVAVTP